MRTCFNLYCCPSCTADAQHLEITAMTPNSKVSDYRWRFRVIFSLCIDPAPTFHFVWFWIRILKCFHEDKNWTKNVSGSVQLGGSVEIRNRNLYLCSCLLIHWLGTLISAWISGHHHSFYFQNRLYRVIVSLRPENLKLNQKPGVIGRYFFISNLYFCRKLSSTTLALVDFWFCQNPGFDKTQMFYKDAVSSGTF